MHIHRKRISSKGGGDRYIVDIAYIHIQSIEIRIKKKGIVYKNTYRNGKENNRGEKRI